MIGVLDNYDSFTYNIVQYLLELGVEVDVVRNDQATPEELEARGHAGWLISPGPCDPDRAGISVPLVQQLAGKVPVFGVCLGHQSIAAAYGGAIVRADRIMHGKTSPIIHNGENVFSGLPSPFLATRYHSLVVEPAKLPAELVVTAHTAEGEVMGLSHRTLAIWGVQFHPESILSEHGHQLLANFAKACGESVSAPAAWRRGA